MKFILSLIVAGLLAGCAEAAKKEEAAVEVKQKFPKCEAAWAKLQKDKPPKTETAPNMIKEKVQPEAPKTADGQKKPGCVVITYEITKEGLAENFRVIEKSDKEAQDAALGALYKWKFRKFEAKNQAIMFVF